MGRPSDIICRKPFQATIKRIIKNEYQFIITVALGVTGFQMPRQFIHEAGLAPARWTNNKSHPFGFGTLF